MGYSRRTLSLLVLIFLLAVSPALAGPTTPEAPSLLDDMHRELMRASGELSRAEPPAYYMSYSVADEDILVISAMQGALFNSAAVHARRADVITRVGSPALDNTHGEDRSSAIISGTLPLNDDHAAIARSLWALTNRGYRDAVSGFLRAKSTSDVRAQEEDDSPDFSRQAARSSIDAPPLAPIAAAAWEERARQISSLFRSHPEVETSAVFLVIDNKNDYFVTTEGTRLVTPVRMARLFVMAAGRAADGMELNRVESYQSADPANLPTAAEIAPQIEKMVADLKALKSAPIAEPYAGPALLSGRAAAVLTHEVLGHRLEGQRQRGDDEGQTFTKKVNQTVLPPFLSVVDDPTRKVFGQVELSGYYPFDDEGTPSEAVKLIDSGVLRNFLLSRMPVKGFQASNGHGRAETGNVPVGRQGNLIMTSTKAVSEAGLRKQLIAEIKRQKKPYGLFFDDIQGGFTLTTRRLPQAFQVLPIMVWRVYPDGRPDELVRGVDLVGTPLAAFAHIVAVGDTEHVFNGVCGAESGSVPVSAVAPAMLFSEFETQRRAQSHERPPILPPPSAKDPIGGAK